MKTATKPLLVAMLATIGVLYAAQPSLAQQYRYVVTEMPVAGSYSSSGAYSVNADGSVVGILELGGLAQAFVWKPTAPNSPIGTQALLSQLAGGTFSAASSISDNGKIAGYAHDAIGTRYLATWDYNLGSATPLTPVTGFAGVGLGINDAGQIAYNSDGAPWVFQGGISTLLNCSWGGATAINGTGDVVGFANNGVFSSYQGTLWTGDNYNAAQNLGALFGNDFRDSGALYAINNSRLTTGYATLNGVPQAIVWSVGTGAPIVIGPNSFQSSGYGINAQGDIVGAYTNNGQSGRPFLYEDGNFVDLQSQIDPASGWYLLWAFDINEFGQICGFGYLNGQPRGYLLTPAQQPNRPPVSRAGVDLAVDCCGTAMLDGSASSDPDGDPLTYAWYENNTLLSSLSNPELNLAAGEHTLTLVVTDPSGLTSSDTVVVIVEAMEFQGFLEPIGGADATGGTFEQPLGRPYKLGSTIPVKFRALCCGSEVLTGIHTLQAIKYSNAVESEAPIDATPTDAATTGNQFRLTGNQWHFNLSTVGLSAGTWKLLATLSDGSQHFVWITIKP